jgi:cytochrome c peroxidase
MHSRFWTGVVLAPPRIVRAAVVALLALPFSAQQTSPIGGQGGSQKAGSIPPSLDTVPVPRPPNLAEFIKNEAVAVQLGKALFWDQQVGSDGRTACASCHHHAGADPRSVNTLAPGANGIMDTAPAGSQARAFMFPIQSDDVVGSQGVVDQDFLAIVRGSRLDSGVATPNPIFGSNPQVTGRNTPTAINAVFNEDSFWDGRAKNHFNGRNPGGDGLGATVLQVQPDGSVIPVVIEAEDSSAASQSVGPPNSDVEMAWAGRTFPDIGKKMLALRPLATQQVHPADSVLGGLRHPSGVGLRVSYARLIQEAFQDQWWNSNVVLDRAGNVIGTGAPVGLDQFSLMEANFSLFWGFAVQMYESILVSSDAPFDRFARGDAAALTAQQQLGLQIFLDQGECTRCHGGAEFTNASVNEGGNGRAFAFIGVDPLAEDPGNAEGEFKTAQLRNSELTGPYFHNGKYATLRQVVDFYDRGGDVANDELEPLGLTETEKAALVDFLVALTDERVRFQRAPFDHPSLNPVNRTPVPAVGAGGAINPLRTFLGLSPFNPGPSSSHLEAGGGGSRLYLHGSPHAFARYWLLASAGAPPVVPERLQELAGTALGLSRAGSGSELVQSGLLDGTGSAEYVLPGPTAGALHYLFVVTDPETHEILAVSNPVAP